MLLLLLFLKNLATVRPLRQIVGFIKGYGRMLFTPDTDKHLIFSILIKYFRVPEIPALRAFNNPALPLPVQAVPALRHLILPESCPISSLSDVARKKQSELLLLVNQCRP